MSINWDSPLTRGLAALYVPEFGPIELVRRQPLVKFNNPQTTGGEARYGRSPVTVLRPTINGPSYTGLYVPFSASAGPYDASAPPITLFGIGTTSGNKGDCFILRGRGSGDPSYSCGVWYGSFSGAYARVVTTGGSLSATFVPTGLEIDTREPTAVVVVIDTSTTTVYAGRPGFAPVDIRSAATPSGTFDNQFDDEYRTLSFGASYAAVSAGVAMGGAVYGRAWSRAEVELFFRAPFDIVAKPQRRLVVLGAGGGGTTFEQAVGGSLTLSGALRKQAAKRTTGSLTATGVLWKQATKLVLGSLTPAGGLAKQTSKYPSGSLAAAGGLVKQTDKAAGGAITGTGSLQRQTNKGTSGSLTLVGLLSKLTSRTLTGSSVPVGAVRKLTEKTALTGSITGSGALATAAVLTHAIAGSITAVGALAKTTLKAAAGSIGLTGVLTKLTQKALSGSLTPQGALSRLTARLVSGSITPAGALAISYQAARAVAGSITAVGALGKLTLKRVVGGITAAGSLAASFIPGGGPTETAARWFNKLVLTVRKHRRRR